MGDIGYILENAPIFVPDKGVMFPHHKHGWDMMVAHPPCTHLSVSGAPSFKEKVADGRQQAALDFVAMLLNAPIRKIALENPVSIISTRIRKPDQIIQPYQFGHDASKKTCLWLKGLPLLVANPKDYVKPRMVCSCGKVYPYDQEFTTGCPECGPGHAKPRWANQTPGGHNKLGPSPNRAKLRSLTYQGIANAMAEQWG